MAAMSATDEIRSAVLNSDRPFAVLEGGKGREPPDGARLDDDNCPVTPLGHKDGRFHFLDVIGQLRALGARSLGQKQEVLTLFGGDESWLRKKFPKYFTPQKTEEVPNPDPILVDFIVNSAARWLIQVCFDAGMFGDHVVLRRPGVWPDSGGLPAVHCGDVVVRNGHEKPAGERTRLPNGRVIVWGAAPPTPRPGLPCEAAIAVTLQEDIQQLFRFRHPGGAIMALGVLGVSYFGAAARWRPSLFLTGPAGCGKSTLLKVIQACSPLHSFGNDTSKAGLTAAIDGRAMLCLIDEQEKSDDAAGRGAKTMMDLVLTSSGGDGTEGLRANADGTVRKISMVGSFVMAATAVPEMRDTHLGRIAVVEMQPPAEGEDFHAQHAELIERMAEWAPRLWGRTLAGWERYAKTLALFRHALNGAGCQPREQDQYGAVLAGWWVLTAEGLPDGRRVAAGVSALDGFIRTAEVVAEGSNARRLVQYLMTYAVQLDRSSAKETIGSLIDAIITAPLAMDDDGRIGQRVAKAALETNGIRVVRATDQNDARGRPVPRMGPHGIWVNPSATEMRRLFTGSDWDGGRWVIGLQELKTARKSPAPVRVGSVAARAIWISLDDLGIDDTPDPIRKPPDFPGQ